MHFLSLTSNSSQIDSFVRSHLKSEPSQGNISLLSITNESTSRNVNNERDCYGMVKSIFKSRDLLASHITSNQNGYMKLLAMQSIGRPIKASHVLGCNLLPLLNLPSVNSVTRCSEISDSLPCLRKPTFLRELVLPHFDDVCYPHNSSLLSEFSNSLLTSPLPGLYQWPPSNSKKKMENVSFRILPSAKEDLTLPPPSIVFQCESLEEAEEQIHKVGGISSKVGFNANRSGQLRVVHKALQGLDIRFCEKKSLSPCFAESLEALMAGSLGDLQSVNVMLEGRSHQQEGDKVAITETKVDSMHMVGDCWSEFRAHMKRPSGFLRMRRDSPSITDRIAKSPSLIE